MGGSLWITFKICIFVTSNNPNQWRYRKTQVVNYFQNLYLCDFQQQKKKQNINETSCELLSKFVSLWLPTTFGLFFCSCNRLWITFKICIFVTSNNYIPSHIVNLGVVNYFQNLYLCDFQQLHCPQCAHNCSCELLSKFVSLWLPTTGA